MVKQLRLMAQLEMKVLEIPQVSKIADIEEIVYSKIPSKQIIRWNIAKIVDGNAFIEIIYILDELHKKEIE
jgi:hypothetical protein